MAIEKFLKKAKRIEEHAHVRKPAAVKLKPEYDESNWLVSYADMMTLLCAFFIMLFSMAHLDERQYEKVRESVSKQFGGDFKSPAQETAKFISQIIQEAGIEKNVVVRSDPTGVAVTFESTIFFDTLSSEVKPQGQAVLAKLIQGISERQKVELKQYRVVVEGHTDSRPVLSGIYPSNWELSGARAARVVRMFLGHGFNSDHLTAIGYADTFPLEAPKFADGTYNEEALGKNRRVVIRILEPQVDSIPIPAAATDPAVTSAPVAASATVPAGAPVAATAVPVVAGNAPVAAPAAPVNAPAVAPATAAAPVVPETSAH
jgi:chemotaxis protein MotB